MGICISKQNLAAIVSRINSQLPLGPLGVFSTNYENYKLIGYGIQPEIYRGMQNNQDGWFSMTARDLWLYTRY